MTALLAACILAGPNDVPTAPEVVNRALALAKRENRPVFLYFRASWCGWCKRTDRLLKDPALAPAFRRSYVIQPIVVRERPDRAYEENDGWANVMLRYRGRADQDVPYYVVLRPDGQVFARSQDPRGEIPGNGGFPRTESEMDAFVGMIRRTGKFRPAELSQLRSTLAKTARR
ncbi:MAG: thioredoxin family protein [Fimbriimonadaceae bacterium]|nr:thioredoxin family protein [Fimbriimonadaceae bacterium]